jgi:acyloxyacyl hydrolase
MFSTYAKAGGLPKNLVEPVDGFHPSQTGNALFAKTFWDWLEINHPDALGEINPYNSEIDTVFPNLNYIYRRK